MGELIVNANELEIVNALHNTGEGSELPMPFEQDIFLYGTEIAGTRHVDNIAELYDSLEEGDIVSLIREPDNPHDEYAIRIETLDQDLLGYFPSGDLPFEDCRKLGYLPRVNNKIIARLMDAGKRLYGVVRAKELLGDYHRIVVKVYMKE